MFILIAIVAAPFAGGLNGNLTYHERFPTVIACEHKKPQAAEELYSLLHSAFGLKKDDVKLELICKADGVDT